MGKIKYITKFYEYSELPFSKAIQDELHKRHTHGDYCKNDEIVYREEDVIIMMQMLQNEIKPHPTLPHREG